jgi:hypothetical protein
VNDFYSSVSTLVSMSLFLTVFATTNFYFLKINTTNFEKNKIASFAIKCLYGFI